MIYAECTIRGQGVAVRCFISSERDVLALEIDDSRAAPPPLKVTVTAVRPLETRTGEHLARVEFPAAARTSCCCNGSMRRITTVRAPWRRRIVDREASLTPAEATARTVTAPGKTGKRLILIASAGSWTPDAATTTEHAAAQLLADSATQSYDALRAAHVGWWHVLWSRTFIHLTCADGYYHVYPTNTRESFWGVRDSITDLAVIRGAGPLAIRAAELLAVDAELREQWTEFIAHLAPYPLGNEPEAQASPMVSSPRTPGRQRARGTWTVVTTARTCGPRPSSPTNT